MVCLLCEEDLALGGATWCCQNAIDHCATKKHRSQLASANASRLEEGLDMIPEFNDELAVQGKAMSSFFTSKGVGKTFPSIKQIRTGGGGLLGDGGGGEGGGGEGGGGEGGGGEGEGGGDGGDAGVGGGGEGGGGGVMGGNDGEGGDGGGLGDGGGGELGLGGGLGDGGGGDGFVATIRQSFPKD
ncbi:hypothetical protein CYMTET_13229 [Cymbomonas tetramitiformis]|uniref:Uncharacterized protein n=1 Tax=Cymbomonas tetramitiformis TaxID=36881 RepID=A0AAE0GIJ7_9CHLO|nr:hypothetical protein CYMTET_13229 [Cymbomonas tetramitiformis]